MSLKKITSVFLSINFLFANSAFASLFADDLANKLDKNLKIKVEKQNIIDDFANNSLNQNLKIKKQEKVFFKDKLVEYLPKDLKIEKQKPTSISDEMLKYLDSSKIYVVSKNKIDFSLDQGKIKVSPLVRYTTRTGLYEGEKIDFVLAQDVKINNVFYKKGTKIKARVETLSKNMAYGVPADLVVGNFTMPDGMILNGQISRQGANRSLWVYPTGYILMPFFLMGAFIFPIRGGHAKLYSSRVYEVEI